MLNVSGKDITISKGDTATISITLTGDVPGNDTIALFTVRENVNTCNAKLEKRLGVHDGVIVLELTSKDTDLPFAAYVWDIRLLYENGDVYTPFKPAKFIVCEVVGDV